MRFDQPGQTGPCDPYALWVNPMECVCISLPSSRHGHTQTPVWLKAVKCKPHHSMCGQRGVQYIYMGDERKMSINRYFPLSFISIFNHTPLFWIILILLFSQYTCATNTETTCTFFLHETARKSCNSLRQNFIILEEKDHWRFQTWNRVSYLNIYLAFYTSIYIFFCF